MTGIGTQAPGTVEEVLERSIGLRSRRLASREITVELGLTLAFLALAGTLWAAGPAPAHGLVVVVLVCAYAVVGRVSFPLGVGQLVPTQPFLVALFGVAPATTVPLLVYAGLLLGTAFEILSGRIHNERLSFAGGDALHALGPAAVLIIAGQTTGAHVTVGVILLAFAAQTAVDLGSSTLREWVACGLRPRQQLKVIARIAAIDLTLLPLGLLAVLAADDLAAAALLLLPLTALLSVVARDRLTGVRRAVAAARRRVSPSAAATSSTPGCPRPRHWRSRPVRSASSPPTRARRSPAGSTRAQACSRP